MSTAELDQLITSLVDLGEDPEELGFWRDIFSDLEVPFQEELLENLRIELAQLQAT